MDTFYEENIRDHYYYPRNSGGLEHPTHSHQEHNPFCGDVIRIDLHVNENNIIDQVAFAGKGCMISLASASMLTEMIKGKTLDEAKQIGKEEILTELGLDKINPVRLKCALLSLKVLKAGAYGLSEEDWNTDDEEW